MGSDVDEGRSAITVIRESRTLAYGLGAVTLAAGIALLFVPERMLWLAARLSGVLILVIGLSDLWDLLRHHRGARYRWLLLLRAAINVAFGAALLFWPGPTINVLVWLVGLDMVLAGLVGLVLRGQLPDEFRGGTLGRSLFTIGLGLVLMIWPDKSIKTATILVGALLATFGLVLLWSGYRISRLDREIRA